MKITKELAELETLHLRDMARIKLLMATPQMPLWYVRLIFISMFVAALCTSIFLGLLIGALLR